MLLGPTSPVNTKIKIMKSEEIVREPSGLPHPSVAIRQGPVQNSGVTPDSSCCLCPQYSVTFRVLNISVFCLLFLPLAGPSCSTLPRSFSNSFLNSLPAPGLPPPTPHPSFKRPFKTENLAFVLYRLKPLNGSQFTSYA